MQELARAILGATCTLSSYWQPFARAAGLMVGCKGRSLAQALLSLQGYSCETGERHLLGLYSRGCIGSNHRDICSGKAGGRAHLTRARVTMRIAYNRTKASWRGVHACSPGMAC